MARIFTEGFEERYVDYQPWTVGGTTAASATGRTSNSYAVYLYDRRIEIPSTILASPVNLTEMYMRYAMMADGGPATAPILRILSKQTGGGTKVEAGLGWGVGDVMRLYTFTDLANNNNYTLQAVGKTKRETLKWYLIEIYYKMNSSTGEFTVKVEGTTEISWTGNTIPQSGTGIYTVRWDALTAGLPHTIDDIAVNDTSGGADNSWVGDGRVIRLSPDSTSSSQWTRVGSGSNNHEVVDELPPNTTDYVKSATTNDTDWYGLSNLPATVEANDTIRRVWASAVAMESTADADEFATNLEIGGTPGTWTNHVLTSQWTQYNGDPVASPSQSDVNGMKVGIKVV